MATTADRRDVAAIAHELLAVAEARDFDTARLSDLFFKLAMVLGRVVNRGGH